MKPSKLFKICAISAVSMLLLYGDYQAIFVCPEIVFSYDINKLDVNHSLYLAGIIISTFAVLVAFVWFFADAMPIFLDWVYGDLEKNSKEMTPQERYAASVYSLKSDFDSRKTLKESYLDKYVLRSLKIAAGLEPAEEYTSELEKVRMELSETQSFIAYLSEFEKKRNEQIHNNAEQVDWPKK